MTFVKSMTTSNICVSFSMIEVSVLEQETFASCIDLNLLGSHVLLQHQHWSLCFNSAGRCVTTNTGVWSKMCAFMDELRLQ